MAQYTGINAVFDRPQKGSWTMKSNRPAVFEAYAANWRDEFLVKGNPQVSDVGDVEKLIIFICDRKASKKVSFPTVRHEHVAVNRQQNSQHARRKPFAVGWLTRARPQQRARTRYWTRAHHASPQGCE